MHKFLIRALLCLDFFHNLSRFEWLFSECYVYGFYMDLFVFSTIIITIEVVRGRNHFQHELGTK